MSKRSSNRSSRDSARRTPLFNTEVLESRSGPRSEAPSGGNTPSRVVSQPEEADVPAPPTRQLSAVPLRVFAVASGRKPDQIAGFMAWAKTRKMGPRTMPEWEKALSVFMTRPVN